MIHSYHDYYSKAKRLAKLSMIEKNEVKSPLASKGSGDSRAEESGWPLSLLSLDLTIVARRPSKGPLLEKFLFTVFIHLLNWHRFFHIINERWYFFDYDT